MCVRPPYQVVDVGACHFDSSFRMVMEYAHPWTTMVSINFFPEIILIDYLLATSFRIEWGNKIFMSPSGWMYQLTP